MNKITMRQNRSSLLGLQRRWGILQVVWNISFSRNSLVCGQDTNWAITDVLQIEAIISKMWGKEDELKQHKSELSALDRKITAELAPKHDENDGTENKQE